MNYKHFLFFCFCMVGALSLRAQTPENAWIDYNREYYRIQVAQDGIYRLSYQDLQAAGVPVNTLDPRRIQLFHRGREQAIRIPGQADGNFDTNDFIEFYGMRNDGSLDSLLYLQPELQPHKRYNLHSDTSAYFLTWRSDAQNGKRMQTYTEANVDNLPPESFQMAERFNLQNSNYSRGRTYGPTNETLLTQFDDGEGWTGQDIPKGQNREFTITGIDQRLTNADPPNFRLTLSGRNNQPHLVEVRVGPSTGNLRLLGTVEFTGFTNGFFEESLNWSDISNDGNLVVRVSTVGLPDIADRVALSLLEVFYPRNFIRGSGSEQYFQLIPGPERRYLEIGGSATNERIFDVHDPNNVRLIGSSFSEGLRQLVVRESQGGRRLLLSASPRTDVVIRKASMRPLPSATEFIILTHPDLRMSPSGADPVQSYADYRSSAAGGGYTTFIYNIREVFDQFSYGEINPIAIRNMMRRAIQQGNPSYLFLVGKGLTTNFNYYRQNPNETEVKNYIPTYGVPAGDIPFVAGLAGVDHVPAVPIGRLNARSASHVENYLEKVKEIESTAFDDLWRKRAVHLSGGVTTSELVLFRNFIAGFTNIFEGDFLGGEVTTISKQTNSSVELINIADEINEGVSMVTFFGHSAPLITDIEIGFVTDPVMGYNNQGRYPTFLVNGCNAGNIFSNVLSFGEDWMHAANKGAISFMAHSAIAYSNSLRQFSNRFYNKAFGDTTFMEMGVGDILKATAREYMENNSGTAIHITQIEQLILQGDPAMKVFGTKLPDFSTSSNQLFLQSYDGTEVTAAADSFALGIVVDNFGATILDSLSVSVRRTLSDGTQLNYDTVFFEPVKFSDTLFFNIPPTTANSFGTNRFDVTLDAFQLIQEITRQNNSATGSFFFPTGRTLNLFPPDYGIEPDSRVALTVQAADVLSDERRFTVQIDTSLNFSSPLFREAQVLARVLAISSLDLPYQPPNDSVVYFWRSRFTETREGEDSTWTVASFTYIPDSPAGWMQSVPGQFKGLTLNGITRDEGSKRWRFRETTANLFVEVHGAENPDRSYDSLSLFYNGQEYLIASEQNRICRNNSLNALAFDRASLIPYAIISSGGFDVLDPRRCGRRPQVINNFVNAEIYNPGASGGGNRLLNAYLDGVQEGDFVLLFNVGELNFQSWDATVFEALAQLGLSQADFAGFQNGDPLIILAKKGGESSEVEFIRAAPGTIANQAVIDFSTTLSGRFSEGTITSRRIGPASEWGSLFWSLGNTGPNRQFNMEVIGIDRSGNESIVQTLTEGSEADLSNVSAEAFPFARLRLRISDAVDFEALQLEKWLLTYQGVPEGILLSEHPKVERNALVQKKEGERAEVDFYFMNISNLSFSDSLTVRRTLFNQSSRNSRVEEFKINAPEPGDSSHFSLDINTIGKAGRNDLSVFVNPNILSELNYNNNVLNLANWLEVEGDEINPILDVTFDGVYILDGEIVSPSPLIMMRLKDDNPFLKKQDTTGVSVFLKKSCEGCEFERIPLSSSKVRWYPEDEDEDFRIEFQPENLEDGMHTLRVQAADASGNLSGTEPYEITFEVVNESAITNFYPYPNPFSTSTRFVFTLTGTVIPDEIKIQIMTVSGRVVREILQDEIGPIRIGHNQTEYAWDGTDEFGDRLANGVYLYRVITRAGGESLDRRETAADKAFKKGFGKLYILR